MKKKIVCILLSLVLVFALAPAAFAADVCTITVTVTDKDEPGTFIEGAEVSLGDYSDTTSSVGICTLVVPQGTNGNLTVYKDGWVVFSAPVSAENTAGDAYSVSASMTRNIWTLTGTVRDENGNPIPNAEVLWGDHETTTGPDGRYTLKDLPAGVNNFTVYAEGYVVYAVINMEVHYGMPDKDVVLDFHTLSGRILDENGAPLAGAEVNWGNYGTFTDDGGYYSMKVLAGTANLTAYKEGYGAYTEPGLAITAGDGGIIRDIVLPFHMISGTVTDANGDPIPGAEVSWGDHETVTDENGYYSFKVLAGTASLTAYADGYLVYAEPDVTAGNGILEKNIVLEANLCTLAGTITDANGKPVSGAEVNWGNYAAFTNDNGYYSMDVIGGVANLTVYKNGSALYSEKDFVVGNGTLNTKNITLSAAADPAAPKTGDETAILPYIIFAGASLLLLGFTLKKRAFR